MGKYYLKISLYFMILYFLGNKFFEYEAISSEINKSILYKNKIYAISFDSYEGSNGNLLDINIKDKKVTKYILPIKAHSVFKRYNIAWDIEQKYLFFIYLSELSYGDRFILK